MSHRPSFPILLAAGLCGAFFSRLLAPETVQAQTAAAGARYVAATGEYQTGVSLLYVLDQKTEHLAVYEARGGAPNSRQVTFVGARDISLDTLLPSFNDESEYKYSDLKKMFEREKIPTGESGGD
ncbi:MAG: hypothetical protein ACE5H3_05105 [Planctomycetota bacterium]